MPALHVSYYAAGSNKFSLGDVTFPDMYPPRTTDEVEALRNLLLIDARALLGQYQYHQQAAAVVIIAWNLME